MALDKEKILDKVHPFKKSLKVYRTITKKLPPVYHIKRELYYAIVRDFHKLLAEKMIEGGHDYKLPKGLGKLFIRKFKNTNYSKPAIDWVTYNKTGVIEYVGAEYYEKDYAKWMWARDHFQTRNIKFYTFKTAFHTKRKTSKAVQYEGKDKVYSKTKPFTNHKITKR